MSSRSTFALLAVVLGLGGFIYFFEQDSSSSGDLEEREGRFVVGFDREHLERLVVVRRGETIELTRSAGDAGVDSFAMARPVRTEVDDEAVDDLVSGIEWAEKVREVGSASASERARFGLARPRVRLTIVQESGRIELAFGADDPTARGVYATSSEAPDVVVVVGKDVFDAVDRDSSAYRVRKLLPGELPDAVRISVRTPQGVSPFVASDGVWWTDGTPRRHASLEKVNAYVAALRELTALRFAPPSISASAAGLDAPFATVEASFAQTRVLLVVGSPCEDGRYARVDRGPIACIADESVAILVPDAATLVERRVVAVPNDEVASLTLTDGTRSLAVTQNEGAFRYALTGAGAAQSGDADATAVADYLDRLRGLEGALVPAAAADRVFGAKLTIARREGASDVVDISLGEPVLARRPGDAAPFSLPAGALEALTPTVLPLMKRSLLSETPAHLVEVGITRAGVREVVREGDAPNAYLITAPVSVQADSARASALFARLASLEAVRFVVAAPLPEHQLTGPSAQTVTLRFSEDDGHGHGADEATHTLVVGAATEGGAFARLDTGAVFVLATITVELVAKPLAARDLLVTDSTFVDGVEIAGGIAMRREAGAFVTDSGPVPAATSTPLLDAIAEIDAVDVVAYGVPAASGFARPRARVTVVRGREAASPQRYVLLIGAEAEGGRTHVRREDLAIDFLVRTDAVSALVGATAPR